MNTRLLNPKTKPVRVLILVLFVVQSISCEQTQHPTFRMNSDFKDFVLFPVGSHWIYGQDGNTNRDSIYLSSQNMTINETRRAYPFNFEQFQQSMYTSFYDDSLLGFGGAVSYEDTSVCFVFTEGYLSNSQERNLQFYTRHKVGTTLQLTEATGATYLDSLSNYTVNGIKYSDVRVFECPDFRGPLMTKKIYYARGVGVIRKELFNGQVWNLLRYKVSQ